MAWAFFKKPFQVSFNYLFTSSFVFVVVLPLLLWILKLACKWVSLQHIHTHVILPSFLSLGFALPASLAEPLPCPYSPLLTFISYVFISFGPLLPSLKPHPPLVPCCPVASVWQRGGAMWGVLSIALHPSLIFPLFLTFLWVHTMKYDHILSPNMPSSQLLVLLFCGIFFLL